METMTGLIAAGWSKNDINWVRREHGGWWQRHQGIRISDSLVLLNFATYCSRTCPTAGAEHFT